MSTTVPVIDPRIGPPLIIDVGGSSFSVGRPPSLKQWAFIQAQETEQLYGGAKRGAKSYAICYKLMMLAACFPGNQIGLFRKTLKDLRESILIDWDKLFPENHPLILRHHRTHYYYLIRTSGQPSVIHYGGLGEKVEFEAAKGKTYGAFAIDEPSEIEEDAYLQMLAQLCWELPSGERPPYMALLGSNPEPGWVEERFRPLIDETSEDHPVSSNGHQVFIRALPRDNPYLPPGWEDQLRLNVKSKAWIDKYLGGSWDVSEGQYFKEFDRGVHCIACPPEDYLRTLKLIASIDHATTGTTCMVVVGIDPDANLIALGSYYQKDGLVSEHARAMRNLMDFWALKTGKQAVIDSAVKQQGIHPAFYAFEYVLIDPSTAAKTQQSQTELMSIQDLYRREGIPTVQAWNALETGLELLSEYVHINPGHLHPIKSWKGQPIFGSPMFLMVDDGTGPYNGNRDGVNEIIRLKKTVNERGKSVFVGKDHYIDNVRYIAMSRPEPPTRTPKDLQVMSSMDRKILQSHDRWAKGFGVQQNSNTWFQPEARPN